MFAESTNTKKNSIFDIRYIKLHFTVEFTEDTIMPKYKASAIRGGMGEMLLRANCIRDRKCEICDFEGECIVRRIMYSKMEIQPKFMSSGDSVGYVIECEDYREEFLKGDELKFSILLFGKTIVYFSQILNALYALGMNGIGRDNSHFVIISVTNTKRKPIMNGADIDMSKYETEYISDYVSYRKNKISSSIGKRILKFQSPATIKFRKEEIKAFNTDAIVEAACRRLYMIDCYEGIESRLADRDYRESIGIPTMRRELHYPASVKRYSNHKKSAMYLNGIEGEVELDDISEELLDILLACELVHIGSNTSFGFGRIFLK